ncbi:MAG: HAD family hydrolase [Rubripirellula sp.]
MIRGVALDMDGLLFDTESLYWECGDELLKRRGRRYCKELQQRMMGRVGVAAMQQMIQFHELDDRAEDLILESNEVFASLLERGAKEMPGLPAWIEFLKTQKIPFGLATSSQRRFVDILFRSRPWKEDLAFILTGDDVTKGKPDPQIYQMAADRLGIPPSDMLVLEDSQNGCAAAVAAGAFTVAIPSEHTKHQDFAGVDRIAESLGDPMLWQLISQDTAVD